MDLLFRATLSEKLAAFGAVILLVGEFVFPWYVSDGRSWTLWSSSPIIADLVLAGCIIGVGPVILRLLKVVRISDQGLPESWVVLVSAVAVATLIVYRMILLPPQLYTGSFSMVGRSWGMWIGFLGMVLFLWGSLLKYQEERGG